MNSVFFNVVLLHVLMCASSLMPGFGGERAAKDLKPVSVVRYDETIYDSRSLYTDKDDNLFYLYPLENDNCNSVCGTEKRFVGKRKKVKLNVPENIPRVSLVGRTDDSYYCDETLYEKNDKSFYNGKKRKLHYYNAKGIEVAAVSLPELWKEVKKDSDLSADCFKRKNNKLYILGSKGEQPEIYENRQYVYAEYDISKEKYTKINQLNLDSDIKNVRVEGKYIYGVKETGGVNYADGQMTDSDEIPYSDRQLEDSRKRQILVYDFSGKLLYDIDYTCLLENYNGKTVSEIESLLKVNERHFLHTDVLEMYLEDWLEIGIKNDCLYDVRNGYIYIATNTGIYRCQIGKRNFVQLADLTGCEFTAMDKSKYIMQFVCVDDNTFAFSMGEDERAPFEGVYVVQVISPVTEINSSSF